MPSALQLFSFVRDKLALTPLHHSPANSLSPAGLLVQSVCPSWRFGLGGFGEVTTVF